MAKAMARFCKTASMVPRCRGAEHAASRRGRIRIIALPTVEEVVVAVSMEPRRCGRARKHGRGREYQKSKFPCHDRASSVLTSEVLMDQSAACSKPRIRRMRGCVLTFAQIPLAFRKERYAAWPRRRVICVSRQPTWPSGGFLQCGTVSDMLRLLTRCSRANVRASSP